MNVSRRNNVALWMISRSIQKNTCSEKPVRKGKIFNVKQTKKQKFSTSDKA